MHKRTLLRGGKAGLIVALTLGGGCPSRSSLPRDAASAVTKAASVTPIKVPIIDSHVHITPLAESMNTALRIFGQSGITKFVLKSAGVPGSPRFAATVKLAQRLAPRVAFFSNPDFDEIDDPAWGDKEADRLEAAVRAGASGMKIFKDLGLGVRLKDGSLLKVDDARLDPLYRRAAKLGAIIAYHVADPVAFFEPITPKNERYDELRQAPDWSFHGKDYPSHAQLMAAQERVIARHPKTIFLGIHLAGYPESVEYVRKLMARYPNLYIDTSARVPEIGRQPVEKVRALFLEHQDRILFGSDLVVTPRGMQLGSVSDKGPPEFDDALKFFALHRRYFETADKQIEHPTPIQGRWKVDAIHLPPAVLRKFYVDNAEKLIFAPMLRRASRGGGAPN